MEKQSRLKPTSATQAIVILDFGSQFTQLIARRIREQNVFSVVLPCTASLDEVRRCAPVGIVLSGAPWSVYDKDAPPADKRLFELGVPVLGICYGLQFMVHTLGGKVRPTDKREYGHAEVEIIAESLLFRGLDNRQTVWMSHGDSALELPPGFELTAKTSHAVAGIQNVANRWFAVQFHPEVHHTRNGTEILRQFRIPDLRGETDLDAAALHRLNHRTGKGTSGHGARHLRAFGRSGFIGGGGAG